MNDGNDNSHRPHPGRRLLMAAGACALAAVLSAVASAQDGTVVVGGSGAPDVQVDLGAINGGYRYGYGPNGRRLLMPNAKQPQGPIVLKPPGTHRSVALKSPSSKVSKKEEATPVSTEPAVSEGAAATPATAPTPPPAPKVAELPPPPPAKKVVPVEGAALAGPEAGAKTESEAATPPVPPPQPPTPSAVKSSTKPGKEKPAAAAETPAAGAKVAGGLTTAEAPPPPPPPSGAKPANETAATASSPPPPPPPAETAAPGGETKAAAGGEQPAEVAALPPPSQAPGVEKPKSIAFAVGAATLTDQAKQDLSNIAQTLSANTDLRLQIVAYASGSDDNASQARRLSLARALAVRSYLIDAGVRSTRMDVRALGNKFDSGPGDRVDLIIVKP